MNPLELSEQEQIRRGSMQALRDMGIEPYPAAEYVVTGHSAEIRENFADDAPVREVAVAGRIMSRRIMGKASFVELQDADGRIQIYVSRDEICPGENKDLYNVVFKKLLDIGDFIGVRGYVFRTQTGEISVHAQELTVLSKSLRPLPIVKVKDGVTYDAFDDPELRYRRRYVDLIVNDGVKEIFLKRTKVYTSMREYFNNAGYVEVETPILQSIPGGASARPFITHHNALDIPLYDVNGTTEVKVGDNTISFKAPFPRVTMAQAIKDHTGVDINGMDEAALRGVCKDLGIEVDESMGKGKLIDEIFGEKCEGKYIQPTFITDYPIEMSPLTKRHRDNPELTERFELMVNGKELANAYSELNDPIDQYGRFVEQMRLGEKGDDEAMIIDADFIRALEYGMPPTSGMGIGMDRLVMLMTGQVAIQEVLLFPQMRPEKVEKRDKPEAFVAAGVPEEWVPVLQKAGVLTVEALKTQTPGKLHQELCGLNKKHKLGLTNPTQDAVAEWTKAN